MVPNPFYTWTAGAALPAILGLVLTPLLVYKLLPPTVTHTPEAPMQVCCVGVDYQGKVTILPEYQQAAVIHSVALNNARGRAWQSCT